MHMTIYALVLGERREEAVQEAESIFHDLVEHNKFEYYDICTPEKVHKASSQKGQELLKEIMETTEREFMEKVHDLRQILAEYTDKELFDPLANSPIKASLFRHTCYRIGSYDGSSVWLYDNYGSGIRTPSDLQLTLGDLEQGGEYDELTVWLVPSDVHY